MGGGTAKRPRGQRQARLLQAAHHGSRTAQLLKLLKDQLQPGLNLGIRMQADLAIPLPLQPNREPLPEFPALSLVAFTSMQTHLNMMELHFTHDAREPQQEPVMIQAGVVELFAICN